MDAAPEIISGYRGPASYALADWRRRVSELYAQVRAAEDPQAGWRLWHETRSALYAGHPMSPVPEGIRAAFRGIGVFPYNPALRFVVDLDDRHGPAIAYDLGQDGAMAARPVAVTIGLAPALGAELTLYWIEGYGGGLFLPFRDATCRDESYGGGRYLIDAIKGADLGLTPSGRLILDFNFAYTPSCALSPDYVCPLAPEENRLPGPVRAGEKTPPEG